MFLGLSMDIYVKKMMIKRSMRGLRGMFIASLAVHVLFFVTLSSSPFFQRNRIKPVLNVYNVSLVETSKRVRRIEPKPVKAQVKKVKPNPVKPPLVRPKPKPSKPKPMEPVKPLPQVIKEAESRPLLEDVSLSDWFGKLQAVEVPDLIEWPVDEVEDENKEVLESLKDLLVPEPVVAEEKPREKIPVARYSPVGRAKIEGGNYPYYLKIIEDKISNRWQPPPMTVKMEMMTTVVFLIDKRGKVSGVILEKSSGNSFLDQSALSAVFRAGPFPPLSSNFSSKNLKVYFTFNLTSLTGS